MSKLKLLIMRAENKPLPTLLGYCRIGFLEDFLGQPLLPEDVLPLVCSAGAGNWKPVVCSWMRFKISFQGIEKRLAAEEIPTGKRIEDICKEVSIFCE